MAGRTGRLHHITTTMHEGLLRKRTIRLVEVLQDIYAINNVNMHRDFKETKCPGDVLANMIGELF